MAQRTLGLLASYLAVEHRHHLIPAEANPLLESQVYRIVRHGMPNAIPGSESVSNSTPQPSDQDTQPSAPGTPPSKLSSCFSPTVYWLQLAGWLMLACLLLPLAEGCDGKVVSSYSTLSRTAQQNDDYGFVVLGCFGWIQFNLGIWAIVWMLVALTRRLTIARLLLRIQVAAIGLGLAAWLVLLATNATLREILEVIFGFGPVVILAGLWIRSAHRTQDWYLLWSRVQHLWLLLAWFLVQLQCIIVRRVLWGYFVFLAVMALSVVAIEIARHRLVHDLLDSTAPLGKPRFSLRSSFAWITGLALFIAYYQQLGIFLGWVEKQFQ